MIYPIPNWSGHNEVNTSWDCCQLQGTPHKLLPDCVSPEAHNRTERRSFQPEKKLMMSLKKDIADKTDSEFMVLARSYFNNTHLYLMIKYIFEIFMLNYGTH
jgi:hypothetical protein